MKFTYSFTLILFLGLLGTACKNHRTHASGEDAVAYNRYGMDTSKGLPSGLNVGDIAPDFTYHINGETQSLKQTLEEGPVMLMFYRGYWCPVCNRYMKSIEDSLAMVRARGVRVLAVAPELQEYSEKTKSQSGTSLDLISDTANQIIDAYDVRFTTTEKYQLRIQVGLMKSIEETNGGSNDLPVPATYLIGTDQKIFFRHFNPDYRHRASIREIVEALDQKAGH